MPLLVGLGNPGPRYAFTRHNAGWLVLDALAARWRASRLEKTDDFEALEARVGGHRVILMKPLTFMNLSGEALHAWWARHGQEEDLLVICDDVYLPLGTVRLREQGSAGGHRGLESIEAAVGNGGFARLRVGVGGTESSADLPDHVLDSFDEVEEKVLKDAVIMAAEAAECWIREGPVAAMNRFNKRVRKEVSES